MVSFDKLDIRGYEGRPIPNTFYKQEKSTNQTALIFPGFGYTTQMPLLFYSIRVIIERGANVLSIEQNYSRHEEFLTRMQEGRVEWLFGDAVGVYEGVVENNYGDVQFMVGKSLGTRVLGYLLTNYDELSKAKVVWLTPLIRDEVVLQRMQEHTAESLLIIGTADPHYDESIIRTLEDDHHFKSLIIENGNHGLQVPEGVHGSVRALTKVVESIDDFFS
ncbi:MAG: hypothetical protein RTU92_07605 [Candidatus Thorarchaeota archaeon]